LTIDGYKSVEPILKDYYTQKPNVLTEIVTKSLNFGLYHALQCILPTFAKIANDKEKRLILFSQLERFANKYPDIILDAVVYDVISPLLQDNTIDSKTQAKIRVILSHYNPTKKNIYIQNQNQNQNQK
jgi:hypothetical protein